jgi:hypothetical protein
VACKRTGLALAVSGSDDGDIKIWDPRVRGAVQVQIKKSQKKIWDPRVRGAVQVSSPVY